MSGARNSPPSWITAAAKKADLDSAAANSMSVANENAENSDLKSPTEVHLSLPERAFAAAGAAVVSAVIVNPLDVAKTRLQAQAAGVPYQNDCGPACSGTNTMLPDMRSNQSRNGIGHGGGSACSTECPRYKGTFDVFFKVTRQEGLSRLWRGTNVSLALAVPSVGIYLPCYDILRNYLEKFTEQHCSSATAYSPLVAGSTARLLACIACYPMELARTRMQAFKETQAGVKPPGVWKTLLGVVSPVRSGNHFQNWHSYRVLWTGLGAQLARDVPFSAICWGTLEPIRRRLLSVTGDQVTAASILGANFSAGFVAGSLAAAVTCPLDVARTRRQIENDPARQMRMTTKQTLLEIWRDGGWRGLFTGIGPRVVRAGPSVGIVVSSYEVVKYALYHTHLNSNTD